MKDQNEKKVESKKASPTKKFDGRIFAIIGLAILAAAFFGIAITIALGGFEGDTPSHSIESGWTNNY